MSKELEQPRGSYDAELTSVIQDDVTAETLYREFYRGTADTSPEKRLLLAMLADAVGCVSQPRWSRASAEALDWIQGSREDSFCSFDNVCELLGLETSCVRRRLLARVAATSSVKIPVTPSTRRARHIPVTAAA